MLMLAVCAATVGDMMLSHGMKQIEVAGVGPHHLLAMAGRVLRAPMVMLAILLLIIYFVLFLGCLAQADVSLVVPATAATYVTTAIFGRLVLRERISHRRALGITLVTLGVLLVWLG